MKIFDKIFGKKEYKRLFQNGDIIYVKEDKKDVKGQQNRLYAYADNYGFKISIRTGLFLDTRTEKVERVIRCEYIGDNHGRDDEKFPVTEKRRMRKEEKYQRIMKLRDEGLTFKEIGKKLKQNPASIQAFVSYMKKEKEAVNSKEFRDE